MRKANKMQEPSKTSSVREGSLQPLKSHVKLIPCGNAVPPLPDDPPLMKDSTPMTRLDSLPSIGGGKIRGVTDESENTQSESLNSFPDLNLSLTSTDSFCFEPPLWPLHNHLHAPYADPFAPSSKNPLCGDRSGDSAACASRKEAKVLPLSSIEVSLPRSRSCDNVSVPSSVRHLTPPQLAPSPPAISTGPAVAPDQFFFYCTNRRPSGGHKNSSRSFCYTAHGGVSAHSEREAHTPLLFPPQTAKDPFLFNFHIFSPNEKSKNVLDCHIDEHMLKNGREDAELFADLKDSKRTDSPSSTSQIDPLLFVNSSGAQQINREVKTHHSHSKKSMGKSKPGTSSEIGGSKEERTKEGGQRENIHHASVHWMNRSAPSDPSAFPPRHTIEEASASAATGNISSTSSCGASSEEVSKFLQRHLELRKVQREGRRTWFRVPTEKGKLSYGKRIDSFVLLRSKLRRSRAAMASFFPLEVSSFDEPKSNSTSEKQGVLPKCAYEEEESARSFFSFLKKKLEPSGGELHGKKNENNSRCQFHPQHVRSILVEEPKAARFSLCLQKIPPSEDTAASDSSFSFEDHGGRAPEGLVNGNMEESPRGIFEPSGYATCSDENMKREAPFLLRPREKDEEVFSRLLRGDSSCLSSITFDGVSPDTSSNALIPTGLEKNSYNSTTSNDRRIISSNTMYSKQVELKARDYFVKI